MDFSSFERAPKAECQASKAHSRPQLTPDMGGHMADHNLALMAHAGATTGSEAATPLRHPYRSDSWSHSFCDVPKRFSSKRLPCLLLACAAGLGLSSATGNAQAGKVLPFEVCQYANPASGKVDSVLSYDSTNAETQLLESGTLENFFSPGDFDLGQPEVYFSGTDNDFFAVSFETSDTDSLTWVLGNNQNTPSGPGTNTKLLISIGSAPPCGPSYFQPAPTLTFSAPGTYSHQLLGQLAYSNSGYTTKVYPAANGSNLSFANLTWTTNPPITANGNPSIQQPIQYLYGDITVGAGNAASTNLLIQINDAGGRQVALGTDTLQFSGSPTNTVGCPSDVTKSVQGSMSAPVQLFGTQIWTQTVMVKNTSGVAIAGPIQLALNNLSGNARLFTAAGTGTCPGIAGALYITIANGLAVNAYGAVVLTFTNSTVPSAAITYTPTIVAGGSRL